MRYLMALITFVALPAFAASGNLPSAAHQLERKANHFLTQTRHERSTRHLVKDAEKFAREARLFHRSVERGYSAHHVVDDYRKLNQKFAHLASVVRHQRHGHSTRHLSADLHAVERALANLSRALHSSSHQGRGYDDRDYDNRNYDSRGYDVSYSSNRVYRDSSHDNHGSHRAHRTHRDSRRGLDAGDVIGAVVAVAIIRELLD